MAIKKELIDELIASSAGSLIGPNGLVKELTKALVERMSTGELNHHLGYEKHEVAGYNSGNSRNGKSQKTLKVEAVPRDRNGTFEPQLIEKHQTRFTGFDGKILSMYALGMTTRDIQSHLQDLYGVDVSAALISEVTDSVLEEVKAWQDRPLEALYPIVYLDALMVKMRQDGKVENRAVYTAIGINMGRPEIGLGFVGQRERGRQVLDGRAAEPEEPGHEGCLRHLHRWAERLSGGDRSRVSEHAGADLHHASDPRQPKVCELERAQECGGGSEVDLSRSHRRAGRSGLGRVPAQVPETPGGGRCVRTQLATGDPVLRLSRRDS